KMFTIKTSCIFSKSSVKYTYDECKKVYLNKCKNKYNTPPPPPPRRKPVNV
ncbi:hypothetical protein J2Z29_001142, partial [Treponema pedis]